MTSFLRTSQDEQVSLLTRYLPHGRIWNAKYRSDTVLGKLVRSAASELARVNDFITDLLCRELDIDQTNDLLLEWEQSVGIPDVCFGRDGTVDQRRARVKDKLTNFGGVTTEADFVRVFESFGIPIELTVGNADNAELLGFPAPPYDTAQLAEIASTIAVRTSLQQTVFPLPFPIPFELGDQTLECLMNRLMPATADLKFFFGEAVDVTFGAIGGPIRGASPFVSDGVQAIAQQASQIAETSPFVSDGISGAVTQAGQIEETSPFVSDTVQGGFFAQATVTEEAPFVSDVASGTLSLTASLAEAAPFVEDGITSSVPVIAEISETSPFVEDTVEGQVSVRGEIEEDAPFVSDSVVGLLPQVQGDISEVAPFVADTVSGLTAVIGTISENAPFVEEAGTASTFNPSTVSETAPFVSDAVDGVVLAPFVPTDISDLELWYDADDAATITDAGGGEVSGWDDKSANSQDLVQTTAAERPNTSTVNGNSGVQFDGNDVVEELNASAFSSNPSTVAIAFTPTNVSLSGDDLIRLRDSAFNRVLSVRQNSADVLLTQGGASLTISNILTNNETSWVIGRFANGTQNALSNSGGTASATVGTLDGSDVDDIIIGGDAPTGDFVGHIHEVLVYGKSLSEAERTAIEDYFNSKWTIG